MDQKWLNNYYKILEGLNQEEGVTVGDNPYRELFDENGVYLGQGEYIIEDQYTIVDKPKNLKLEDIRMQVQVSETYYIPDEYLKFLTHFYVDQYTICEDNYYGWLYYPLPDGKYIKFGFSC